MMNATERFCTLLRGEIPDRVPILVYAMEPGKLRCTMPTVLLETPADLNLTHAGEVDPNVQAVLDRAGEVATFAIGVGHPSEALFTGAQLEICSERREYCNPDYYEWRNVLRTPKGELRTPNKMSFPVHDDI